MIVKNITDEDIVLIGKNIKSGSEVTLETYWNLDEMYANRNTLLAAWRENVISISYNQSSIISSENELIDLFAGILYGKLHSKNNKYYFVKCDTHIPKNSTVDFNFLGNVESLTIIAKSTPISVDITSGEGLILQSESVKRRQEFELHCNGKLANPTIKISSESAFRTAEVYVFIDGYSSDSVEDIQDIINEYKDR